MYTIFCDGCGADINEDGDYAGWSTIDPSLDTCDDEGWFIGESVHYCPNCHEYDDNDNLILKPKKI